MWYSYTQVIIDDTYCIMCQHNIPSRWDIIYSVSDSDSNSDSHSDLHNRMQQNTNINNLFSNILNYIWIKIYCGIFIQSKICGGRETDVAR
jgi:hypothetical protein